MQMRILYGRSAPLHINNPCFVTCIFWFFMLYASTCTKGMWLGTSCYIHLLMCYVFKDHMSYIRCKQLTIWRSACFITRRCEKSFSLVPEQAVLTRKKFSVCHGVVRKPQCFSEVLLTLSIKLQS
ncbi:hypothetical protein P167DRAFT_426675 [Morchella conica CCBAS932]|uniref:Uncharacterized protein n=1 Tax=Morchella conica CCBAS932 TaxID=1392247 RepID=A0A3N4L1J4_9PEZI|nr:hypothetical protein P167DRAFT_426675 [Morchella conica CCBAS932]